MEVALSREREAFVRRCVEEGSHTSPEAVVAAALGLLERRLIEDRSGEGALRRAAATGLEQVAAGRGGYLVLDDIKRRARRRVVRR